MKVIETLQKGSLLYDINTVVSKVSNIEIDTKRSVSTDTSGNQGTVNISTQKTIFYDENKKYIVINSGDFSAKIGDELMLIYYDAASSKPGGIKQGATVVTGFKNGQIESRTRYDNVPVKDSFLVAVKNKTTSDVWYFKYVQNYFQDRFNLVCTDSSGFSIKTPLLVAGISALSIVLFQLIGIKLITELGTIVLISSLGIIIFRFYKSNPKDKYLTITTSAFNALVKENEDFIMNL
jgi:hypothetical protein